MKILLPMISASSHPDGVMRHAVNLARCLLLRAEIEEVHLLAGHWQARAVQTLLTGQDPRLRVSYVAVGNTAASRNAWYLLTLPALARRLQVDLVHTVYPVPLLRFRFACAVVTTLHDLYPWDEPHNFGYPRVLLHRLVLAQCLRATDAIACVSESTYGALERHRAGLIRKAVCIFNCVETTAHEAARVEPWMLLLEGAPFLLVVAQHRRNKNLTLAIRVFQGMHKRMPSLRLALVGNAGPETAALQTMLHEQRLESHVLLLQHISEPQLQWCYRHGMALLATSTSEGFGLPVVEAMLVGCPVVCSDIPAFRELLRNRGTLVPLTHQAVSAFCDALENAFLEPRPQPCSGTPFSASILAGQYVQLYRAALQQRPAFTATTPCHPIEGEQS